MYALKFIYVEVTNKSLPAFPSFFLMGHYKGVRLYKVSLGLLTHFSGPYII